MLGKVCSPAPDEAIAIMATLSSSMGVILENLDTVN